jgi:hypothetical protein
MENKAVHAALRDRLGAEATGGLLDLFETVRREWREDVIEVCATRFERRLVEEVSQLRVEMVQGDAALRQEMSELGANLRREMADLGGDLRGEIAELGGNLRREMAELGGNLRREMAELGGNLRREMAELGGNLRREMAELGGGLRQEISAGRFELLKWCFVFWIGQVVAVAAILGVMLRFVRP